MQFKHDRHFSNFTRTTLVIALFALSSCQGDPDTAPPVTGNEANSEAGTDAVSNTSSSSASPSDNNGNSLTDALALAAASNAGEIGETGETSDPQNSNEVDSPSIGAAQPDSGLDSSSGVVPEPDPTQSSGSETDQSAPTEGSSDAVVESSENTSGTSGGDAPPDGAQTDSVSETADSADSADSADTDGTDHSGSTIGERFTSRNTEGFDGTVQSDGSILVRWPEDRTARGYNLYRDGDYFLTVFDLEYLDEDTSDGSYYYEVQAFDHSENYQYIARGLTVKVRGSGREDPDAKQATGVDLSEFDLVFFDEFDGEYLDLDKWDTAYIWGDGVVINSELQHYVDLQNEPDFGFEPFTFGNGALTINSIETPAALSDKANGQPYLSGVITSYDAFKFTYGYAEARARTPYGKGLWSAFWLLNAYYDSNGDADPEIDIMEHIGDNQDTAYHTYHYYDNGELRSTESHPVKGVDFTAEYHTFAVDWRPGVIVYYIDGVETKRIKDPNVSNEEMYVIANTALGGWWPGSPDETTEFPSTFDIDYIRVYQKRTPYDDPPLFDDGATTVPLANQINGNSPNHRPPADLFPNGVRP